MAIKLSVALLELNHRQMAKVGTLTFVIIHIMDLENYFVFDIAEMTVRVFGPKYFSP